MRRTASGFLGTLFLLCFAVAAHARQYPPGTVGGYCNGAPFGPGCPYPDTLINVSFIQKPAAIPHPVLPDTVWGIGGIVTGFDAIPSGFAFYIQNRAGPGANGAPWTGVDIFTAGKNYQDPGASPGWPGLAIGDSVVCYGKLDEFSAGTELRGLDTTFGSFVIARRVSSGNSLPNFHVGTVNELHMLPTNGQAEQWEGCLVKVNGPLRVARQNGLGVYVGATLAPDANYIAVNNTLCPPGTTSACDSLVIDTATLANVNAPAVGTIITSVQGIYEQRNIGAAGVNVYELQIRSLGDVVDTEPPDVADAFSVEDNIIRVVFDRNVTAASAQTTGNYTLGSLASVTSAVQVSPTAVHLTVSPTQPDGATESVQINHIVSSSNSVAMTSAQTKFFVNGVLSIAYLQGPTPDSLAAPRTGGPAVCLDYMRHLGGPDRNTGLPAVNGQGVRITTRGVATANFGGTYWLQDQAGGQRSGLAIFAPITSLVTSRLYTIATSPQEFFGESELNGSVFIRDDGPSAVPAPLLQTVGVLSDTSCDATNTLTNGEDYEHTLVRVQCVQVERTGLAGESFRVTGPYPTFGDTILIDNNIVRTYVPKKGTMINVNGFIDVSFGSFRIQPRGDSDISPCTAADVGTLPLDVSFSIFPNPSASSQVSFGLPQGAQVELAVYDLLGRRLAVLAKGNLAPGRYTRQWNGKLTDGSQAGSGVYFYRLKVNDQIYKLRAVRLD